MIYTIYLHFFVFYSLSKHLKLVFAFTSMLVSYGYYNKSPQTWRLKTAQIYSPTVLEDGVPKSVSLGWNQGVGSNLLPLGTLGKNLFHCVFQPLELYSWPFSSLSDHLYSLAHGPFLHLQNQQWQVESFFHGISLTLTLLPPMSTFKGTCGYTGPA